MSYDTNLSFCKFRIPDKSGRVIWEVTNECNYGCKYCIFASTGKRPEGELSTSQILDTLTQLKENNFSHIKFTGGEPFLRTDMIDILEETCKLGFSCDISTNASKFTPSIVQRLSQLPLEQVHISLDGHDQYRHESVRGKKSFLPTMEGLELLLAQKSLLKIRIGCVIHKYNENHLSDMIDFCESLGLSELIFSLMEPVGRLRDKTQGLATKSAIALAREIEQLINIKSLKLKVSHNMVSESVINISKESFCPAGSRFLFINSLGVVSPCTWVSEYKPQFNLGSLSQHSLSDILKNDKIRALNKIIESMPSVCPITELDKFSKLEKREYKNKFGINSQIYAFATENLEYMTHLDFSNKKVLTVGGSFDQAIIAGMLGATHVENIDINLYAKHYGELKYQALLHFKYDEFKRFFLRHEYSFEKSLFNRLKHNLSPEALAFFTNLYKTYRTGLRESEVFNNRFDQYQNKIDNAYYLRQEEYYLLAQEKMKTIDFLWTTTPIEDFSPNNKYNYDIILLSNIADYSHKMFKNNHVAQFKEKIVDKYMDFLSNRGILMFAYIYDSKKKNESININNEILRKKLYGSYEEIIIPTALIGVKGVDAACIIRNRNE